MAPLTRDQILGALDLPTEAVEVPEWGGTVHVRGLTAAERDQYEASQIDDEGKVKLRDMRAWLVALCTVDEAGVRLFTERDVQALGAKNARAMTRIAEQVRQLSGMGKEADAAAVGNSDGVPLASSPSGSPVSSGT